MSADLGLEGAPTGARTEKAFRAVCLLALFLPLLLLLFLIAQAALTGVDRLDWQFFTSFPSRRASAAGIKAALAGTAYLMVLTFALAIPVGVGAAIYLEEYARPGRITSIIEVNINNLAGVPSIIYGLLGLEVFVRVMQMGRSLLAGACTLALLLLPMVILSAREAVPRSLREGAYALGAYRFTTIRKVVLPLSLPGILTGIILSLARAIGETAPLITIGASTFVSGVPESSHDEVTALLIQIFNWVSRPQAAFQVNAAAAIVVLLALMLVLNAAAVFLRMRLSRRVYW